MVVIDFRSIDYSMSCRQPWLRSQEADMWMFLAEKLRRDPNIPVCGNIIWEEFRETTECPRSVSSLNTRFRRYMLPNIVDAPVEKNTLLFLMKVLKVPVDEATKRVLNAKFKDAFPDDNVVDKTSPDVKPNITKKAASDTASAGSERGSLDDFDYDLEEKAKVHRSNGSANRRQTERNAASTPSRKRPAPLSASERVPRRRSCLFGESRLAAKTGNRRDDPVGAMGVKVVVERKKTQSQFDGTTSEELNKKTPEMRPSPLSRFRPVILVSPEKKPTLASKLAEIISEPATRTTEVMNVEQSNSRDFPLKKKNVETRRKQGARPESDEVVISSRKVQTVDSGNDPIDIPIDNPIDISESQINPGASQDAQPFGALLDDTMPLLSGQRLVADRQSPPPQSQSPVPSSQLMTPPATSSRKGIERRPRVNLNTDSFDMEVHRMMNRLQSQGGRGREQDSVEISPVRGPKRPRIQQLMVRSESGEGEELERRPNSVQPPGTIVFDSQEYQLRNFDRGEFTIGMETRKSQLNGLLTSVNGSINRLQRAVHKVASEREEMAAIEAKNEADYEEKMKEMAARMENDIYTLWGYV